MPAHAQQSRKISSRPWSHENAALCCCVVWANPPTPPKHQRGESKGKSHRCQCAWWCVCHWRLVRVSDSPVCLYIDRWVTGECLGPHISQQPRAGIVTSCHLRHAAPLIQPPSHPDARLLKNKRRNRKGKVGGRRRRDSTPKGVKLQIWPAVQLRRTCEAETKSPLEPSHQCWHVPGILQIPQCFAAVLPHQSWTKKAPF